MCFKSRCILWFKFNVYTVYYSVQEDVYISNMYIVFLHIVDLVQFRNI